MSALDFNSAVNDFAAAQRAVASSATKGPTLLQLARAAIRADEAERAFAFSDDPADQWRGVGDRRDLDLWDARTDALAAFLAALERETGIDRELFARLGGLL